MKFKKFLGVVVILLCLTACSSEKEKVTVDPRESIYTSAQSMYEAQDYEEALKELEQIPDYKDSSVLRQECQYGLALQKKEGGELEEAITLFSELGNYKESGAYLQECYIYQIQKLVESGEYQSARQIIENFQTEEEIAQMKMYCDYYEGMSLYQQKKYIKAIPMLINSAGYGKSNKCLRIMAKSMLKQKKYKEAQKICEALEGLKGIEKIKKKALYGRKYEKYGRLNSSADEMGFRYYDFEIFDKEEAEYYLEENVYGLWKVYETGETYIIDKYYRGGRPYGIKCIYIDELGWGRIYYYYLDQPKKIYSECYHISNFQTEAGGVSVPYLLSVEEEGYAYEEYEYTRMDEMELQEKIRQVENEYRIAMENRAQSEEVKEEIYSRAKSTFASRYRIESVANHTFSFTNMIYQDIDSIGFSYDSGSGVYSITIAV